MYGLIYAGLAAFTLVMLVAIHLCSKERVCAEEEIVVPPYFSGDKVNFINGENKKTPGTVLEASDHETDKGQQRVLIKYLLDPVQGGLGTKRVNSRIVELVERPV